jgi:hypothetical protein
MEVSQQAAGHEPAAGHGYCEPWEATDTRLGERVVPGKVLGFQGTALENPCPPVSCHCGLLAYQPVLCLTSAVRTCGAPGPDRHCSWATWSPCPCSRLCRCWEPQPVKAAGGLVLIFPHHIFPQNMACIMSSFSETRSCCVAQDGLKLTTLSPASCVQGL